MAVKVDAAGLFPAVEHLQAFSDALYKHDAAATATGQAIVRRKVSEVISNFVDFALLPKSDGDSRYFLCSHADPTTLADKLHPVIPL
jgi:hypothetical protein